MKFFLLLILTIFTYSLVNAYSLKEKSCMKESQNIDKEKQKSQQLPGYYIENAFCLSATKKILGLGTNYLYSTIVNVSGVFHTFDWYQIFYQISICNECPDYNIFNISMTDVLSFTDLNASFGEQIITVSGIPGSISDDPSLFNLTAPSISYWSPTQNGWTGQILSPPSTLSAYPSPSCKCNPDKLCAIFNVNYTFSIESSNNECTIYSSNFTNCISLNGTICYKNSHVCTSVYSVKAKNIENNNDNSDNSKDNNKDKSKDNNDNDDNDNDDKFIRHYSKSNKKSHLGKSKFIPNSISDNLDLLLNKVNTINMVSDDFPDYTSVCAFSCSNQTVISNQEFPTDFSLQTQILCSLSPNQNELTINGRRSAYLCDECSQILYDCVLEIASPSLQNIENNDNIPLVFTIETPFNAIETIPPYCSFFGNLYTLLCNLTSLVQYPILINSFLCASFPPSIQQLSATTNILYSPPCINVTVNDTTTLIYVPIDQYIPIQKQLINGPIVCSPFNDSTELNYTITVNAPNSNPILASFTDISSYPIVSFDISPTGYITCELEPPSTLVCVYVTPIPAGSSVVVSYQSLFDCTLCNTIPYLDSVYSISNNLTQIVITPINGSCPRTYPNELTYVFDVLCPPTQCDCVSIPFTLTPGANFTTLSNSSYIKPGGGLSLGTNFVDCYIYLNGTNTVYGSFIYFGGNWVSYPSSSDTANSNHHMPTLNYTNNYSISCCAYQNPANGYPPITNTTSISFHDILDSSGLGLQIWSQTSHFQCSASSSFAYKDSNIVNNIGFPRYIPKMVHAVIPQF